jgi:predicted dehydrogenase
MRTEIGPKDVYGNHSRRSFLKTGAAGLSAVVASQFAYAAEPSEKKIRIGVVGGGFGTDFFWHQHPNCVVTAVSDLRPDRREKLKRVYSCDTEYESLEKLVLDKNVDAVAIFTDGPLHVQHVVEAMKNGKHAISAVPACWGSLEEAQLLLDTVKKYGLTYMMAETGYWQQSTITARKYFQEGKFGDLFYCEAEYQHPGLEALYFRDGQKTWRYGLAPMHYPTHTTSQLIGVTGERLTGVVSHGWGDDDPICKDNPYNNPFWSESAMFSTNKNKSFRANIWWRGAFKGCERAQWIGSKLSLYMNSPHWGQGLVIRSGKQTEKDDAGFVRELPEIEKFQPTNWWETDMLPEPLRHISGHEGSHTFITNEFVMALVEERKPAVDVYEALAYTVPGIVAHESSLRGGEYLKIPQFDPTPSA